LNMTHGYSQRLIEQNRQADGRLLGVQLGRVCIEHQTPVSTVAREFKVSRQTVYNWFTGAVKPSPAYRALVDAYLAKLS
jgi:DNA invertase Pin-like site-specific DNA recombinase